MIWFKKPSKQDQLQDEISLGTQIYVINRCINKNKHIFIYLYKYIYILKKKKNNLGCEDAALEASVNAVFYLHLSHLFNAETMIFKEN